MGYQIRIWLLLAGAAGDSAAGRSDPHLGADLQIERVIVETGVAHGGSLIFYAGLCAAMGKGHDRDRHRDPAPQPNRSHRLSPMIQLMGQLHCWSCCT